MNCKKDHKPCAALLALPKICDRRGNLTALENESQIPFRIARTYWIFDTSSGYGRDGHAFYSQEELLVALSGSFDVSLTDSQGTERTVRLDRPDRGLYLPPLTWRSIVNLSTNAVILVLSSTLFDEDDYIRDRSLFQSIITHGTI